jgi:hypothetical protein
VLAEDGREGGGEHSAGDLAPPPLPGLRQAGWRGQAHQQQQQQQAER